MEGSQEMDTTQVRAQGAGEIKQPLSTVGGRESMGGTEALSPSSQLFKGS